MTTTLRAYHGDEAIKTEHLNWLRADIAADRLQAGSYGKQANGGWQGCPWGCFLRSTDPHSIVESAVGIPQTLSRFADTLFERLSALDAEAGRNSALEFFEAIKPGANLDSVPLQLFDWLLTDRDEGVLRILKDDAEGAMLLESISTKIYKLPLARALDRALDRALALDLARALDLDRALALARALARALALDFDLARALARALDFDFDLDFDRDLARALALALARRKRCAEKLIQLLKEAPMV